MPLPSIGGGVFLPNKGPMMFRLFRFGHANRPFWHIVITSQHAQPGTQPVEQLGTYDPMPNTENQKLLSLNIERTRYWMGQGAVFSRPLAKLLGEAGFLPIHPETYQDNWRYRYKEAAEEEAKKKAEGSTEGISKPPSSA